MDDLYDEFGNYIGPDVESSSSSSSDESEAESEDPNSNKTTTANDEDDVNSVLDSKQRDAIGVSAIVLHEDKKYYPEADEVYPEAEVIVQDEDAQGIDEPIIKPIKVKSFSTFKTEAPNLKYNVEFLSSLHSKPALIRTIAVVGHLHHGKTSMIDVLVESTFQDMWDLNVHMRYTDTRIDEQKRKLSIKSTPISLALEDGRGKTYAINLIDCPGHVNFSDESTAAFGICDGVLVVVDAVEGVLLNTKRMVKHALANNLTVNLCISKIDRLIHELKLPPQDAYFKLAAIIADMNSLIADSPQGSSPLLNPAKGNVIFASGINGYVFSVQSFARLHLSRCKGGSAVNLEAFVKRLWGDIYYDGDTGKFLTKPVPGDNKNRSFVHFILEPLYKIYAQVLGEETASLVKVLKQIGVKLTPDELLIDPKPLLKLVLSRFFAPIGTSGAVDMFKDHIPSPDKVSSERIQCCYASSSTLTCSPQAPLRVRVTKLYSSPDAKTTSALGKVFSGSLKVGQKVKILGESFSRIDQEDQAVGTVSGLSIPMARHNLAIDQVFAGSWVLIVGIDSLMTKSATIVNASETNDSLLPFAPLRFNTESVLKLAIQPVIPSELPKMIDALRSVSKSYPLLKTKVEESGEHVILGTGELYLDCVMHDMRLMYGELEIKVSDPIVSFCETVVETSALKTFAETPNKKNKISMICEPLEKGLPEAIENGEVTLDWPKSRLSKYMQENFDWDRLAARSLWAFGPGTNGPNALLDDTLAGDVNKKLISSVKDSVVQGFKWASREGPLCDEPLRGVKFRLLDAEIAKEAIHRGAGFVIPTARRVAYSSYLTASPRLLEPVYFVEIQSPLDLEKSIHHVIRRRRGHITDSQPLPGSPFSIFSGYIPVIDSLGFETDLRAHTQGQAFCHQVFDHWNIVPGDPLDSSIVLRPLEPSKEQELAREFMVKTRRRKGLPEDVSINKYFDDPVLLDLFKSQMRREKERDDSSSDSDDYMEA